MQGNLSPIERAGRGPGDPAPWHRQGLDAQTPVHRACRPWTMPWRVTGTWVERNYISSTAFLLMFFDSSSLIFPLAPSITPVALCALSSQCRRRTPSSA